MRCSSMLMRDKPVKTAVLLTRGARQDLSDILAYLALQRSLAVARQWRQDILVVCQSLAELSDRGSIPPELAELGISDYRQLHFKSYRVIYRRRSEQVSIVLIADARRDMKALLQWRLLNPQM